MTTACRQRSRRQSPHLMPCLGATHPPAGLNCGRWDYIFSFIKKLRNNPNFVLPDRQATAS